ncbi:fungal transcriptional regulatory protein [Scheffersomyces xylosifermentans]|uniref:fungal transcriptional regulatory protein n=1 Tax=Scheffersomyces xylosifermentans TaxID=1304137 RepID=UPI00315D598A
MTPTSSNPPKASRHRKRVPVSCLICKKRKVKCDKVKPACGGCVRNGVEHLCEYLEPHWSQGGAPGHGNGVEASADGQESKIKKENQGDEYNGTSIRQIAIPVEQTEEYRVLRAQHEKIVHSQRKEIEDLKRQLSVLQQLSPKVHDPTSDGCKPITILSKLNNSSVKNRDNLNVINDPGYSVLARTNTKAHHIDTYSWINLIKLDPQLTTLWFKITNLQKIYHTYKMNMLNNGSKINTESFSLGNSSVTANPLSKKSPHRINEIDFTYSICPVTKGKDGEKSRCPVIECDFNFMTEDQITPSPMRLPSPAPLPRTTLENPNNQEIIPNPRGTEQERLAYHDLISEKGKNLLIKVQNLWDSTLNLIRGNEKINYKQLYFLIDFYFNNSVYDIESRDLLSFYRYEIQSIIKKNGNEIALNLSNDPRLSLSDEELFERLKMKGVYLCMLALVIEESLDILRSKIKSELGDDISLNFQALFPTEIIYLGLGPKSSNILFIVQEFVTHVTRLKFAESVSPSLCLMACSITLLNREIAEYKKDGATSDPKPGFTTLFTVLLKTILKGDSTVELWKDPELIVFKDNQARKRNKELKIHMCYIWTDLVRLANLAAFNFVPLIKHSERLDNLLRKLYTKIEEADSVSYHLKYITTLNTDKLEELTITLHVHYLISRVSSALTHGIMKVGDPRLTVSNLDALIRQCNTWLGDPGLQTLRHIRKFEATSILTYLSYFMKYILLLQGEENMDEELVASLVPEIFIKYLECINQLRKVLVEEPSSINSQYLLSAVTELLTRLIQIIVALLMRVANDDNTFSQETILRNQMLKYSASNNDKAISEYGIGLEDLTKTRVVDVVEDSVNLLSNSQLLDKDKSGKLSKLWKFYLTFVKNSRKMTSINYAKIHANIPQFRGVGSASDIKDCPVMTIKSTSSSSPLSKEGTKEFTRCPISHITTPMDDDSSTPSPQSSGKCPIDHMNMMPARKVTADSKKRKCPFDHTAIHKNAIPQTYNQMESNIRGEEKLSYKRSRTSESATPTFVEKNENETKDLSQPLISEESIAEIIRPEGFPAPNLGQFDFQAFNDFDFDFLQNEALLEQIEFGNEQNAGSIEGFFQ